MPKITEGKVRHQDKSKLNIPKPSGQPPAPNASMHNATVAMCKANKEITRLREQLADAEKVIERLDYYARDESSTLVVNHMVQQYRKKYGGEDE